MSSANSIYHLKRRIDDYLWSARGLPMQRLRRALEEHFLRFDKVALIGGILRDFARVGRRGFASDIDLVVDIDPTVLDAYARRLHAKSNRFGGYAVYTEGWKIDFWALKNTWAHRQRHVRLNSLSDLPKSTFFNFDAVIYDLHSKQIFSSNNYIDTLSSRVLDINLRPTPSIDGNLLRAIRRTIAWDLSMGEQLKGFVRESLTEDMFVRICETEKKLYPEALIAKFADHRSVLDYCLYKAERSPAHSQAGFQFELAL